MNPRSAPSATTPSGYHPAFVTTNAVLREYWRDNTLSRSTQANGELLDTGLRQLAQSLPATRITVKGRGLARGLAMPDGGSAGKICLARIPA